MKSSGEGQIWVFGDSRNERFLGFSLNVLAKARELASAARAKTAVVLVDTRPDTRGKISEMEGAEVAVETAAKTCVRHGADFVYILKSPGGMTFRADLLTRVLCEAIERFRPAFFLFALTDLTRELAPRCTASARAGLIAECTDLRFEDNRIIATCPAWGGEMMADITFSHNENPGFVSVHPWAFQSRPMDGDPGLIQRVRLDNTEPFPWPELLARSTESAEHHRLEDAKVVVVGGAGMGSAEDFGMVRELASALGGEVGATRPPVLLHWIEEERLIGQTGKTVQPELLISVGTSGAVQYTAGIMNAKTIVAVNRDKNAPIFQVADLGVEADAKAILPLLTEKIKQTAMRKLADAIYDEAHSSKGRGLGGTLRKLREAQAWSVEDLSDRIGESPELIEKVEQDETTPSVGFLLRLSDALKVNPSTFFKAEEKAMIRDQRSREFIRRTENYSYRTLTPGAEADHLRAFMVTIEPKQVHKPVAYKHTGEEFIFVMEGDLVLTVAHKVHHLRPGESIHFNSDLPHKLKSASNEATRCLVVLYTP